MYYNDSRWCDLDKTMFITESNSMDNFYVINGTGAYFLKPDKM